MATVADDSSSYFKWTGAWGIDHTDDAQTPKYMNSTFHATTKSGDYVIIAWTGKDIAIYGARRSNHGIYGISVDNGDTQFFSGFSADDTFQQVLFATSGLAEGDHQVKVSNENARNIGQYPNYIWFDLDYIAFTGTLNNANTDGAPAASSSPPAAITTSSLPNSSSTPVQSSSPTSVISSSSGSSALSAATFTNTQSSLSPIQTLTTPASGGIPITTGSPATQNPNNPNSVAAAGANDSGNASSDGGSKNTIVAVSGTIVGLAALVILVVGGIWWHRKRKRRRELLEADQDDYYARPQPAWRQM